LDFVDNTFKTSGWASKYGGMTESERGHYFRVLDVSALNLAEGFTFVAEYRAEDRGTILGEAHDVFTITEFVDDASIARKAITNRQEETAGLPGRLVLYDDDGTTPLVSQELRDYTDNQILPAASVPAKRGANTL